MSLKSADKCQTINEIRNQIDILDKEILNLFAQRHKYVERIVAFKEDEKGVIAINRKEEVIKNRSLMAGELGLNAKTFEEIFSLLIESNIKHELEIFRSKK